MAARALMNFKDPRSVEPLLLLWDKPEIIDKPTIAGILAWGGGAATKCKMKNIQCKM